MSHNPTGEPTATDPKRTYTTNHTYSTAGDDSLGELVAQASVHISTLVRSEIELAKAELKFDVKRVGTAGGLFGAAALIGHLVLILASFTIAFWLVALGLSQALAFTIVTAFYIVVAAVLVFIGRRRLTGLNKMQRTTRTLKHLKSGPDDVPSIPSNPKVPHAT